MKSWADFVCSFFGCWTPAGMWLFFLVSLLQLSSGFWATLCGGAGSVVSVCVAGSGSAGRFLFYLETPIGNFSAPKASLCSQTLVQRGHIPTCPNPGAVETDILVPVGIQVCLCLTSPQKLLWLQADLGLFHCWSSSSLVLKQDSPRTALLFALWEPNTLPGTVSPGVIYGLDLKMREKRRQYLIYYHLLVYIKMFQAFSRCTVNIYVFNHLCSNSESYSPSKYAYFVFNFGIF